MIRKMKENKKRETKNLLFAAGLFFLGILSLLYLSYTIATVFMDSVPALKSDSLYHSTKTDQECRKGNIFSCAKETFGWGSRD